MLFVVKTSANSDFSLFFVGNPVDTVEKYNMQEDVEKFFGLKIHVFILTQKPWRFTQIKRKR